MVSEQGPVLAPRLQLPPAEIGKVNQGCFLRPVLDPCSKETTGRALFTELRKFNFIVTTWFWAPGASRSLGIPEARGFEKESVKKGFASRRTFLEEKWF